MGRALKHRLLRRERKKTKVLALDLMRLSDSNARDRKRRSAIGSSPRNGTHWMKTSGSSAVTKISTKNLASDSSAL